MTSTLILRGVYDATGAALVMVGQPAVAVLELTMPNPLGYGPDVPQDLTGRAFAQRLFLANGMVAAEAAGVVLGDGQVRFTLDSVTLASLLPTGQGAVDLTHQLIETTSGGGDTILAGAFAIRAPRAGVGAAVFVLDTDSLDPQPLIVRYAGAPAPASAPGGARWTVTGPTFAPSEYLGTFLVSDGFTIDPGPRSWGWCNFGGPAAPSTLQVLDATSRLIVEANLSPSVRRAALVVHVSAIPAQTPLDLFAAAASDINLTSFSLVLAPL